MTLNWSLDIYNDKILFTAFKDKVTSLTVTALTTGHMMHLDHAHPSFSPDNKRFLIQSGLLSEGQSLDLMVIDIPAEWAGS